MARPTATPEQRDRQRALIRRAAAEVYAESGIRGVSVRAIAKRAGVSTGTLYSYFANLQELMRSLWREPVEKVNRHLEEVARRRRAPLRRVRALLEAYADFARAHPDVYRGAFLFVRPDSVPRSEAQPLGEVVFYRLLRDALREGQERGEVRTGDPGEMAQLLWAGVHGAVALPINVEAYRVASAERLVPAMIRTLLRSIEA